MFTQCIVYMYMYVNDTETRKPVGKRLHNILQFFRYFMLIIFPLLKSCFCFVLIVSMIKKLNKHQITSQMRRHLHFKHL